MIKVDNISKNWGSIAALSDVSFTVNQGEIIGFLGPNGAGKSTAMNIITGYIRPTKGSVIVEGFNVSNELFVSTKQIGYLP